MANRNKISACFLCLRQVEKSKAGHGYSNFNGDGNVDHLNCDSGDLLLLKRFLSWSLDLPPAVIGDLLCTNAGTGEGQQGDHGENLLCGSCKLEMGAACQLFQELAKKLTELGETLEKSIKKVSDKLKANLHQKVAKQLNHSRGSTKEGGRRVQRLRDLLALKLATAKTKYIENEVEVTGGNSPGISGIGTSESDIEDFQGVHHENRKPNEPETVTVVPIAKVELDQGEDNGSEAVGVNETVEEENEGMDLGVPKDNGGHRHRHGGSNSTSASTATNWKENRGLVVERPFTCLKCSESFRDMDSVQRHQRLCKPMVSSSSGNGKPMPIPTSGKAKMKPVEPGNRADIDVNLEERGNSSAAAEAEDDAGNDIPIDCLRCHDPFKSIQDFKKHLGWCELLKVQDLKMTPGPAKIKLGKGHPDSGLGRKSKDSKPPETIKCRFCCKTFCKSSRFIDLKRHERIHTGEKPFQCPKCKKRFNTKSSCRRHLKICKVGRTGPEMKNGNEVSEAISLEVVTVTEQVGDLGNGGMKLEPDLGMD